MIITNEIASQLGLTEAQVTVINNMFAFVKFKTISELQEAEDPFNGYFPIDKGNGELEKIKASVFYQIIGNVAIPISPSDQAPTLKGWYKPQVSSELDKPTDPSSTADWGAKYPNAGNLRAKSGYDTLFYFDGVSVWKKTETKIPLNIKKVFDAQNDNDPSTMKAAFDASLQFTEKTFLDVIGDGSLKIMGWDTNYTDTTNTNGVAFNVVNIDEHEGTLTELSYNSPVAQDVGFYWLEKTGPNSWKNVGNFVIKVLAGNNIYPLNINKPKNALLALYLGNNIGYSQGTTGKNYMSFNGVGMTIEGATGSPQNNIIGYLPYTYKIQYNKLTATDGIALLNNLKTGRADLESMGIATKSIQDKIINNTAKTDYYTSSNFHPAGPSRWWLSDYIRVKAGDKVNVKVYQSNIDNIGNFFDLNKVLVESMGKGVGVNTLTNTNYVAPTDGYITVVTTDYGGTNYSFSIDNQKLYATMADIKGAGGVGLAGVIDALSEFGVSPDASPSVNTSNMNAAIAEAYVSKKEIHLPNGIIKHNGFNHKEGVIIRGSGMNNTTLLSMTSVSSFKDLDSNNKNIFQFGGGFFDMTIDGGNIAPCGLELRNYFYGRVQRVMFKGFTDYCVKTEGFLTWSFDMCEFYLSKNGFYTKPSSTSSVGYMQSNLLQFNFCYFVQISELCLNLNNASNIAFNSCNFENCGIAGNINTGVCRANGMSPANEGIDITFSNCWSEGVRGMWLNITNSKGVTVFRDTMVHKAGNGGAGAGDAILNNGCKILLTGSTAIQGFDRGVVTDGATGITRVDGFVITGNHIESNGGQLKQVTYS